MKENLPTRKQIRLKDYDYSTENMYFITICVKGRECILSKIMSNKNINKNVGAGALDCPKIILSQYGKIIEKHINRTNEIYNDISIDDYVIMPNHIHLIINVKDNGLSRAPTPTNGNSKIPSIISMLKRFTNKESGIEIWQRNYYEHIIRNEKEYFKVKEYIKNNEVNWKKDKYF